uniref:Golgin-45 n=1 Tax=Phallusia mammillata TaxID=59560 RepID=A0A6F9D7V1_9ASCI|nr:golgin-45 [Phallusia mammillata]
MMQAFGSPRELRINREPTWPSVRREVGDGMEAEKADKISSFDVKENEFPPAVYSRASSPSPTRRTSPHSPIHKFFNQPFESFVQRHHKAIQTDPTTLIQDPTQFLNEEKAALKDHLQIQIQVNQELKRLLVASVGEDLGYHYERLATEKAQLQLELNSQEKKYEDKCEELETLKITCDVWRSKFLASRMQCEELLKWKRYQERCQQEMESAVRGLLREHWQRSKNLESLQGTLQSLTDVLRLPKEIPKPNPQDSSENCNDLAQRLSQHFLGKQSKISISKMHKACETTPSTPAEKYVLQLLSEQQKSMPQLNLPQSAFHSVTRYALDNPKINRFHSYTVYDNVTLNCCNRCKGDIHVV